MAYPVEVSGLDCRSLSKSCESQGKLLCGRDKGRRTHGIVQPVAQFTVSKEVQPQHGSQIGQGPIGLGEVVQPFQQKQGDQGCPNLDAERVLAGADEGLDVRFCLSALNN